MSFASKQDAYGRAIPLFTACVLAVGSLPAAAANSKSSAATKRVGTSTAKAAPASSSVHSPSHGLLHRVGKMEECLFGAPNASRPLHERITELEKQTVGTPQPGGLAKRLDGLEKVVNGKSSNHYYPPIAPQLDVASVKPATAPPVGTASIVQSPVATQPAATASQQSVQATETHQAGTHYPASTSTTSASTSATPTVTNSAVDDMLRQGTAAFGAGHTDDAEKIFKEVLVKSPFNPNATFNLGAIAERKGDLAGALGNYRTALIGAPNDPQIQQAIAQIESQIAQKQDSPFRNPLVSTDNGQTLLRGSASEFDPLASQQPRAQQPQSAPLAQQPLQPRTSGWRTAGTIGMSIIGAAASGALRGAIRGGGSGALNGAISSGGRRAVAGVFRATTAAGASRGALGAVAGNAIVNSLHCPICRLLP